MRFLFALLVALCFCASAEAVQPHRGPHERQLNDYYHPPYYRTHPYPYYVYPYYGYYVYPYYRPYPPPYYVHPPYYGPKWERL